MNAADEVREFLAQRANMRGLDPDVILTANYAPLTVSALTELLDAFEATS